MMLHCKYAMFTEKSFVASFSKIKSEVDDSNHLNVDYVDERILDTPLGEGQRKGSRSIGLKGLRRQYRIETSIGGITHIHIVDKHDTIDGDIEFTLSTGAGARPQFGPTQRNVGRDATGKAREGVGKAIAGPCRLKGRLGVG